MNGLIERVYAYAVTPITQSNTSSTVGNLFDSVASWLLWIAGAAAFIYLVYSGILYISAAGNPDQAKKGQQGVINAIIGIVVVALAAVIINVVNTAANTGKIQ